MELQLAIRQQLPGADERQRLRTSPARSPRRTRSGPGTYNDITIPTGRAPGSTRRGGATGLAAGQSAGIYHIKGTIHIGNDSYLFGDGVTLVFDQGADIDVDNGGGFVLNYGTLHNAAPRGLRSATTKHTTTAITRASGTVSDRDCQDYAYAAWTTAGQALWSSGSASRRYDVQRTVQTVTGQELGITFCMCTARARQRSRFKLATANMGYLFNGVLYAPDDDVQLGGGKDGQSAAGQIVGWTIEYHGGTRILQNWYGDPTDGAAVPDRAGPRRVGGRRRPGSA